MADKLMSEIMEEFRTSDAARREKKAQKRRGNIVRDPDIPVELETKERGWDVNYPAKNAGDELMGKGAADAMSVQRPKRPDQITRIRPGEEDSAR